MGRDALLPDTVLHYVPAFAAALVAHAFAIVAIGVFGSSPALGAPPTSRAVVVFTVAPEDAQYPGLKAFERIEKDWPTQPETSTAGVAHAFLSDIEKIAARAPILFPFLTPGLALEHFSFPPRRAGSVGPVEHKGQRRQPHRAGALQVDEALLQRLVDRSWSRRDRWHAFEDVVKLAQTYDGDTGQLPDLLQRYSDQNALQPYADADRKDPRLWVQLGIAADHVDFIGFIRRYTSEHPGTRTATNLLFLLDAMAQGSRDALAPLLEADLGELNWTRDANRRAYELLSELKVYYQRELKGLGLESAEAVTRHYEGVRLAILDEILRSAQNRYRAGDALFLKGAIYWRQKRASEALQAWRRITIDANDSHVQTYSQMLAVLQKYRDELSVDENGRFFRDMNHVLKNAQEGWFWRSYERLKQFGHRVDTF